MGDNQRNANQKEHVKYHDVRPKNKEQVRHWNVNLTTSLQELYEPAATSSHSCIVLPPTNATHFDLKPHVIQLLPSFHSLDENPYSYVKTFKDICAIFKFHNFSEESVHLRLFHLSLQGRARHGWISTRSGL
jgi:hypothetical protein